MATEQVLTTITLPAGADLSTHQYKVVKLNSSGQVILMAAASDFPLGILQNKPTSGQAATVVVSGVSKAVAGGSITMGGATGRVVSADGTVTAASALGTNPTFQTVGMALKGASSGDIIPVLVGMNSGGNAST